jgi:hypothetical protein
MAEKASTVDASNLRYRDAAYLKNDKYEAATGEVGAARKCAERDVPSEFSLRVYQNC